MLRLILPLLLFLSGFQNALAACSSFLGDVTLNEYNHQDNFLELKILDPTVSLTGWSVKVYDKNDLKSTTTNLSAFVCAADSSYIQLAFGSPSPLKGKNTTVALLDGLGNEVDWFYDSGNSTRPSPTCASFPYDIALSVSGGGKDFARYPDGTGDWQISAGTGADSVKTPCASNTSLLTLTKTSDKSAAYSGDAVTFTLTVQNASSLAETSLVVEDILPVGLSYLSHVASSGSYDSGTGQWTLASLAGGASATLTLTASVIAAAPATLTNTARLIGSGTLFPAASSSIPVTTAGVSVDILVTPAPSVSGFNAFETATAAGSVTGVIQTKIAGTAYSLDVVALKNSNTAVETTFNQAVKVEVLGSTSAAPSLDGNGCPVGATTLATVSPDPTIAGGRATLAFPAEGNAWRYAKIRISHPAASPTLVSCSGDAFAIRPASLAALARHSDWTTAGDVADLNNGGTSGNPIHKAGQPFTLKATGYASTGAITSNYDGSPEAVNLVLVAPATVAGTLTPGGFSASGGTVVSDTANYTEAGAITLELQDQHFADVDSADSSAAERHAGSASFTVGRFVPDHFDLSLNTPEFVTGCATGGFTYLDQPFVYATATQPVISVTSRSAGGTTTRNYTGALWKITSASLTAKSYTAASGTLDTGGLPAIDPVIADAGSGTGTLTFDGGTGLLFTRPASPSAPFDAEIALAINVIDGDGVAYAANPAQFGAASAGNGIAFSGGKAMRYGRLALRNAYGSELLDLPVPLEAQYWTGSYYTTHGDDGCTVIPSASVLLSNYQKNLNAGETTVSLSGALSAGRSNLKLTKPGAGNSGSVDLTVDNTAANLPWFGANPTGQATFGVYGGNRTPIIFWREQY
jgi:MSHA biogenesis protein MshQ